MTKKKSSWPSSGTKPTPVDGDKSIGTEHSTLGSDQASPDQISHNVVALPINVSRDGEAKTCLPPQLASCLVAEHNAEFDVTQYHITEAVDVEMLKVARSQILELCQPATRPMMVEALTKLRALTAHRTDADENLDLIFEAYIDHLGDYPADAVIQVLNEAPYQDKWWPAWHDIKSRLDIVTRDRRLIIDAIDCEIAKLQPKTSIQGLIKGAVKK